MSLSPTVPTPAPVSAIEERIYAKATWRLIPFLFLCYVAAYLDRVNVGFAKLQMSADLRFSDTVYGLGAGIFFLGYFLFEVPSSLILQRMGARRWIARIMITWGLISAATMMVTTPATFYALRFFLGLAEAGFFPGIIFYLTCWFPAQRRGRIVAQFMTAIALSGVVGGPLSGWIMQTFAGMYGWTGWQWLFLLEGLPAIGLGVGVWFYLDDSIRSAKWLNEAEKKVLEGRLAEDAAQKVDLPLGQVLTNGRVWLLSGIYFAFIMGLYGVSFWLPQLIRNTGVSDVWHIGLLTMIPYGLAAVGMVLVGQHSDRTDERRWHAALCALAGAAGLGLSGLYEHDTAPAMAALSLATVGILSSVALFWTLPTAFLTGTAAAAGIAMINSIGNLAGFLSPYLVGFINDATHRPALGLYLIGSCLIAGALLVIVFIAPKKRGGNP